MNAFLLDARALVKRYLHEPGNDRIDHLFARASQDRLHCLMLGIAEAVVLLSRARRTNRLTPILYSAALFQLRVEVVDNAGFTKLPVDEVIIRSSVALLERYRLGALDGLVVQTALDFASDLRPSGRDLVVVTPTPGLFKAARAEGLLTFNPEKQTTSELDALIGP